MPWIAAGANVAGSLIGASSASKASKAQQQATERAIAAQQQAGAQVRTDLAPYRNYGTNALERLQTLLGIAPEASTREGALKKAQSLQFSESDPLFQKILADFQAAHRARFGTDMTRGWTADADAQAQYQRLQDQWRQAKADEIMAAAQAAPQQQDPMTGFLLRQFTGDDLENDPGYKFGLSEGQKAMDRKATAAGGYFSGAALKEAARYGQDYAGTKFNEAYQRNANDKNQFYNFLTGGVTTGQNSAVQTGAGTQSTANNTSSLISGQGNAMAAAAIAGGNAWSQGLTGAATAFTTDRMLKQLEERNAIQRAVMGGNAAFGSRGYTVPTYDGAEY